MTCPSDAPHGRFCRSSTTWPPSLRRENQVRRVEGSAAPSRSQHQAFGSDWPLIPGHVGAGQRDESPGEVAVGDGIGRTVDPVELREGVQLNCTAKDVAVERQGLTSSARERT